MNDSTDLPLTPTKIKDGALRHFSRDESSIPAGSYVHGPEKDLGKAFSEMRIMVEAVQRYSNFAVSVLNRLERVTRWVTA